jgi:phospholipid transport system substrate-binding protein
MKWMLPVLVCLSLWLVTADVSAQEIAPDQLIKSVSDDVLEIVRKDKEIQAGNAGKTAELIDAKVLPHFNFAHMTALAVGKDWRQATPPQQKVLTEEFRTLLVRTYSKALTEYREQAIEVKPFRMQPTDTEVMVRTQVAQRGAKPVQIDYSLEKADASWKVFDISVAGVSLVTNYRSSFGQEIRANGIDGLITSLRTKNQGGAGSKK